MKRVVAPSSVLEVEASAWAAEAGGASASAGDGASAVKGGPTASGKKAKASGFTDELAALAGSGASSSLERPPLGPLGELVFQWVDMDMTSGAPLAQHPIAGRQVPGMRSGETPVIRVFGVTQGGHSILVHVHGVTPYFYCDCPSESFSDEDCGRFREALDLKVRQSAKSDSQVVVAVVPRLKQSIMGYSGGRSKRVLQVMFAMPSHIPKARFILQQGDFSYRPGAPPMEYMTYESNVPFTLRYMVDNGIVGGNWLELPRGGYAVRAEHQRQSHCQVEVDCVYDTLVSHDPNVPGWAGLAPLRVLSFDIECMGRKGFFPDPKQDPVIQIATYLQVQGEPAPRAKVVFVMGSCLPIVGATVRCFDKEPELLLAWTQFVQQADPDIVTGYNIQNFDFQYLVERAAALKIGQRFSQLSKLRSCVCEMKKSTFSSAAFGTREQSEMEMPGRVVLDMITYMYRNHKMSSYSLNAVAAEFLGSQKEDVHHSIIADLQRGSNEDRRRLAVYCLKDAFLPMQLMDKLLVLVNYVEMARVTGVPIPFLLSRGQQIKVLSMLYRKCLAMDVVIPVFKSRGGGNNGGGGGGGEDGEVGYEGATVIDPIKGFYDEPIATLDFASLYPSIMQAHNLCYTTLLNTREEEQGLVEGVDFFRSPAGNAFVSASRHKGILPIILEELLTARKRAKKDMKEASDPLVKDVMNGRQLALKVSANSVYGFTGATVGSLPCLAISASVTAYGRDMIMATKDEVESMFTVANGFAANATVVYGDTDSVMVKFGVKDVKTAMQLGQQAAKTLTDKLFKKPIALEFEKVYYPYLLMNKKRYAGMYWSRPDKPDKMDCKGIETVRRDNCGLVRNVIGTVLDKILVEHSVDGAVEYVKDTIRSLLHNKVDISLLIISKQLSGKSEDYAAKQAHVELADRMRERDPGSAPVVGDRVPYVFVQKAKGTPAYLKSEDPIFVLENNMPIDYDYYLENQLSKPLLRIFEGILPDPSVLLKGEHTRSKIVATPNTGSGIMKFAVKMETCMGCKTQIKDKGGLCANCEKKRATLYLDQLDACNELEERFARLWTQCQRCQGSLHQDVLCTSKDCPIFYMRRKVQHDLQGVQDKIAKFEEFW